jgi:hypothetical protein
MYKLVAEVFNMSRRAGGNLPEVNGEGSVMVFRDMHIEYERLSRINVPRSGCAGGFCWNIFE